VRVGRSELARNKYVGAARFAGKPLSISFIINAGLKNAAMDIVTQGLLGATLAQAGSRRRHARLATLVGFGAGLLADADAFIQSTHDPLLTLEFHRHFTHALVFIPVGAFIATAILWPFLRGRLAFAWIYLYAFLGYATSGFLDACTSYGTHLLWPFTEQRIAWSIISIFDPVFSLTLILAILYGVVKKSPAAARFGLVLAFAYLGLGVMQHQRAQEVAGELAAARGHATERLVVKPTMGNLLLWRSIYENSDTFYVDAVRVGISGPPRIYPGHTAPVFQIERDLPQVLPGSVLFEDIRRFGVFSEGYVVVDPARPDELGDVRYAMLPNTIRPLWGIRFDAIAPDRHAIFVTHRDFSSSTRQAFISMLLGGDAPDGANAN